MTSYWQVLMSVGCVDTLSVASMYPLLLVSSSSIARRLAPVT